MSHILATTKTNAREAALVAFGVPVALLDRVSDQLNTRIGLDSYVGQARERGERMLDGCTKLLERIVPRRHLRTTANAAAATVATEKPAIKQTAAKKSATKKTAAKQTAR